MVIAHSVLGSQHGSGVDFFLAFTNLVHVDSCLVDRDELKVLDGSFGIGFL